MSELHEPDAEAARKAAAQQAAEQSAKLAAHLRSLEEFLLDPAIRRDRAKVAALLDDDFVEFGSSGRIWSRAEILDLLATEDYSPSRMEDYACHRLAPGIALVTYRSVRTDPATGQQTAASRSSIWIQDSEGWRVRFHQGTRLSEPPHDSTQDSVTGLDSNCDDGAFV